MSCWNRGIKTALTTEQAVSILMSITEEEKVNVGICAPLKPRDNCIFIVNAKLLGHRDDALSDNNGVWTAQKGALSYYFQKNMNGLISQISSEAYGCSEDAVHFRRRRYKSQSSSDYSRTFWFAEDGRCVYIMLQYLFQNDVHDFEVKPHKNSTKKTEAHRRTFSSTLQTIKDTGRENSKARFNLQVQCRSLLPYLLHYPTDAWG